MDTYDFDIFRGSTFSLSINLKDAADNPIDLTDYSVSGYLKYRYSDSVKLVDLGAQRVAPYTSGVISLSIAPSGTQNLPITLGKYDIEIYHTGSGIVDKVLYGDVSIYPEVTY